MSEPMPGAVPAQQDTEPAEAAGAAGPEPVPPEAAAPEPQEPPRALEAEEPAARYGSGEPRQHGRETAYGEPDPALEPGQSLEPDQDPDIDADSGSGRVPDSLSGQVPHGEPELEHEQDQQYEHEHAPETDPEPEPEPEDEGPRPLGLHVEPTGHAPVDAQLRRLEDADHLAVSGHLEVYEDVHRGLREALSGLDRQHPQPAAAPGAPGPSAHGPGRPVPGPPYPRS